MHAFQVTNDFSSDSRVASEPGCHGEAKQGNDLWLPDHIYACATPSGAVLLDARHNQYFGLGSEETRLLHYVLKDGFPGFVDTSALEAPSPEAVKQAAMEFLGAGFATNTKPSPLRQLEELHLDDRLFSVGEELEMPTNIKSRHLMRLLGACVHTKLTMKFGNLETISEGIRRRKSEIRRRERSGDREDVVRLVCAFRELRPYVFSGREQCLFHALSLAAFLLSFQVPATWVIGVRTRPWGAHSWIQYENMLLDTNPERVLDFTPILTA